MTTSSDDSDLERVLVAIEELRALIRERDNAFFFKLAEAEAEIERLRELRRDAPDGNVPKNTEIELVDALTEIERLRELLREARCDVAEIAGQQTKQHRIEAYREQLAAIDAALGVPK
jgi:hypothetical protein